MSIKLNYALPDGNNSLRVTVFGGSQPKPGDDAYDNAYRLGQLLGSTGCDVLTGGYIGTMEAVSRGASEAGAHVIGVTCDEIESWRPVAPNTWLNEEMRFASLRERLFALIDQCDAAFALAGGIGTLAELSLMWTQLQVSAINPKPLILIGDGWKNIINCFYVELGNYVMDRDRRWLYFESGVEPAFKLFRSLFSRS